MKIALLLISLCFAPMVFLTGCQTPTGQTQSSGDPIVVNAEKTIAIAFDVVDAFLLWEYTNRAAVSPDVRQVADRLREKGPDAFRNARSVLRAYKTNRSPEQKALLDTWLATVLELAKVATETNTR